MEATCSRVELWGRKDLGLVARSDELQLVGPHVASTQPPNNTKHHRPLSRLP